MNSSYSWNPATLLFFTDGLSDARNVLDQEFSVGGIQGVCRRHAGESPLDLLDHLFSTIQDFTTNCKQWDNMTAAYFHFAGYSPLAFSTVVNWAKLCLFSIDLSLLLQ